MFVSNSIKPGLNSPVYDSIGRSTLILVLHCIAFLFQEQYRTKMDEQHGDVPPFPCMHYFLFYFADPTEHFHPRDNYQSGLCE